MTFDPDDSEALKVIRLAARSAAIGHAQAARDLGVLNTVTVSTAATCERAAVRPTGISAVPLTGLPETGGDDGRAAVVPVELDTAPRVADTCPWTGRGSRGGRGPGTR